MWPGFTYVPGARVKPPIFCFTGWVQPGEVWQGLVDLIERNKAGRWLVPDFRGHGRSPWERPYTYDSLMAT